MSQIFAGLQSEHVSGHPMRSEREFAQTFEDEIRKVGAPQGLMSNQAKAEMHRMSFIDDGRLEACCQHQNPAERKTQDAKRMMNNVMDRCGTPSKW